VKETKRPPLKEAKQPSLKEAKLPPSLGTAWLNNVSDVQSLLTVSYWKRRHIGELGKKAATGKCSSGGVLTLEDVWTTISSSRFNALLAREAKQDPRRLIFYKGWDVTNATKAADSFRDLSIELKNAKGSWEKSDAEIDEYLEQKAISSKDSPEARIAAYLKTAHNLIYLGGHIGDKEQAETYARKLGEERGCLLTLTLKPGAHRVLFSPEHMAPSGKGHTRWMAGLMFHHFGRCRLATANEGALAGYLGVKSERHGAADGGKSGVPLENGSLGFCVSAQKLADPDEKEVDEAAPSRLLFQALLESVTVSRLDQDTLLHLAGDWYQKGTLE
jgi:hypothetical protein